MINSLEKKNNLLNEVKLFIKNQKCHSSKAMNKFFFPFFKIERPRSNTKYQLTNCK